MKKFISMVMAAAMVVSLVPATAFAANTATFKVVGDYELTEKTAGKNVAVEGTEVQLKVTDVNNAYGTGDSWKITLDFENAEVGVTVDKDYPFAEGFVRVRDNNNNGMTATLTPTATYDVVAEDDSVAITLTETDGSLEEGDTIILDLDKLGLYMTKKADVKVTVGGKFGDSEEMTLVSVLEEGIKVTLKKVGEVGEECTKGLKSDMIVETVVGNYTSGQRLELKLNKGFEWANAYSTYNNVSGLEIVPSECEEDLLVYTIDRAGKSEFVFDKDMMQIEAVDAKAGDVAKITVKVKEANTDSFKATATVDALTVIGETITLSVEEDVDMPVMWSGVAPVNNYLNDDTNDYVSLEITIEESVAGTLDVKKDLSLMLTEGVYVTDVDVVGTPEGWEYQDDNQTWDGAWKAAYEEGKHKGFVFERKTFVDTEDLNDGAGEAMDVTFEMTLMAVPGFEGDVELTLSSAGLEEDLTVTIATFKAPYTVEAAQNDLIIDYRNTKVPTAVVVKEAEAGLWNDGMAFDFAVEYMDFEGDPAVTVNEESEMEVDVDGMYFVVDEESDEEAAVVTIDGIELYMSRNLAAGAYDLELGTPAGYGMMIEPLFTTEDEGAMTVNGEKVYTVADIADWDFVDKTTTEKVPVTYKDFWGNDIVVKDGKGQFVYTEDVKVTGYFVGERAVVKEAFVNIITAGRDQDDASFTKKVVVPVGESYIIAGEETVALDVPAYINANGYTMLPVRAVAVALGINNNNVIWSQAAKQVTILYGQRIITMTVGQSVVYVNGSAIPASAAVEVVDGRAFLGLRDLANALGVTTINYDAATKTATLN